MRRYYNKKPIPEVKSWQQMKDRCLNKRHHCFHRYGGRGITIDDSWLDFDNFFKDMGHRPIGYSLDRIDNNGNYCKSNCRWSDKKTQSTNTSQCKYFSYKGDKLTISQIAEKMGCNHQTISERIKRGWDIKKIMSTPIRNGNNQYINGGL